MSTSAPTDDALVDAINSSQWPRDLERASLDVPERRWLAEQIVGARYDPWEAWERLRSLREAEPSAFRAFAGPFWDLTQGEQAGYTRRCFESSRPAQRSV